MGFIFVPTLPPQSGCVEVEKDGVRQYQDISKNNNPLSLEQLQENKHSLNKQKLAIFLKEHPIPWSDGKFYGVTEEDQKELSLNMTQYQLAIAMGIENPILEWHATHEECTTWNIEDLKALMLQISAFVYPYIRHMQALKVRIFNTTTVEELNQIELKYELM